MNKKIQLLDILLIITIIIMNILPGTPLRYNIDVPNVIINILSIIYIIIGIKKKEKIIINKFVIFAKQNEHSSNNKNIISYIYLVVLIILLYFNVGEMITLHIKTDNIEDYNKKLNVINTKIVLSPYYYKFYEDKVNCLTTMKNIGIEKPNYNYDLEIIKSTRFITDIEKLKESHFYSKIIMSKINLINENNQDEILKDINNIWVNEVGEKDATLYEAIKGKLKRVLDNEKTDSFINELKLKNEFYYN